MGNVRAGKVAKNRAVNLFQDEVSPSGLESN